MKESLSLPLNGIGHRNRLKQRFKDSGASSLADHELLELVLFYLVPRKDTKTIAKTLLNEFHSFRGIFTASIEQLSLVSGIAENTAIGIKAMFSSLVKVLEQDLFQEHVIIKTFQDVLDYYKLQMAHLDREEVHLLLLDQNQKCLKDVRLMQGNLATVVLDIKTILQYILQYNASGIMLIHNHPYGSATPSSADISATTQIKNAIQVMDVVLHDHIIIAPSSCFSFKGQGLV